MYLYRKVIKAMQNIKKYHSNANSLKSFKVEFDAFSKQAQNLGQKRFELNWSNVKPYLYDKTATTAFDRHYIYHPSWAARVLVSTKPEIHYDISSTLYFCSIISAFIPVKFYDYRPAILDLSGLESNSADLTNLFFDDESISSLSCMHTVEHIGLGRYGDPLDYNGDLKAIKELSRVLKKDGNLLFVTPIGNTPMIIFNAHRIYTKDQIITYFEENNLYLYEFALIPEKEEDGGVVINPSDDLLNKQKYACGCFWFKK